MRIFPSHITFVNPEAFYLLLLLVPAVAWYLWRGSRGRSYLQFSDTGFFRQLGRQWKSYLHHLSFVFRSLAFALLVIALARPQSSSSRQTENIEGIDIILAMDISGSMMAEDFRPNRLEAAKAVATDFIKGRPTDRMGMVVFSGESFTQCPLTTDHGILLNLLTDIQSGMLEDGTAIGDGLATAVNRLKESKAVSKVIILLTDGENNRGFIDPLSAGEIAKIYGIRVYTIGVGTIGMAPYPIQTPFGIRYQNMEVRIDEPLMQQIAEMTNGQYFRATNKEKLIDIYKQIDQLEKSKIDVTEYLRKYDEYKPYALAALILLLLDFLLSVTLFKKFP